MVEYNMACLQMIDRYFPLFFLKYDIQRLLVLLVLNNKVGRRLDLSTVTLLNMYLLFRDIIAQGGVNERECFF